MENEKTEENILVTTLNKTRDLIKPVFYSFKSHEADSTFCTGISNAEAGTKYMLANYKIDQIYVLGPKGLENEEQVIQLRNAGLPAIIDPASVSELEFYSYRIAQFLNRIDIEANDVLLECNQERKDELERKLKEALPQSKDGYFYEIASNEEAYKKYQAFMAANATEDEALIQKYNLYTEMDSAMKMRSLKSNDDISVRYVGVDKLDNGEISSADLFTTMEKLFPNRDIHYNLYMDLQGMDKGDSMVIWNILTIYQNMKHSISLEAMICTQREGEPFAYPINNESERYDIELLLSGIRSFIYYGKIQQFEDYCQRCHFTHKLLDNLLKSMRYVDTGVTLNNSDDLTYGMKLIRRLLASETPEDMTEEEKFVFGLLKSLLKKDYGRLLESDNLDIAELISWAMRKGFYQQALTMVEALVPEDMVQKGIFYYAQTKEDLEEARRLFNIKFWDENPKNRFVFKKIDHMYVKTYGRGFVGYVPKQQRNKALAKFCIRMLHEPIENCKSAYSNLGNDDMLCELLVNYYDIGNLRNEIAHAEARPAEEASIDAIKECDSIEQIKTALRTFIDLYRSVCRRIEKVENAPKPLLLNPDDFYAYTEHHKIMAPKNGESSKPAVQESSVRCECDGNEIFIRIKMQKIADKAPADKAPEDKAPAGNAPSDSSPREEKKVYTIRN